MGGTHGLVPQWRRHGDAGSRRAWRGRRLQSGRRQGRGLRPLLPLPELRLPPSCSSGTDWWIYDHNRVFVQVEGNFTYDSWIAGLRAGRTFISNGPLLEFTVDGRAGRLASTGFRRLRVKAQAISRLPFDRLQIIRDGVVVAEQAAVNRSEANLEREIPVEQGGWIAARMRAQPRDTRRHRGLRAHQPGLLSVRIRRSAAPRRRAVSSMRSKNRSDT